MFPECQLNHKSEKTDRTVPPSCHQLVCCKKTQYLSRTQPVLSNSRIQPWSVNPPIRTREVLQPLTLDSTSASSQRRSDQIPYIVWFNELQTTPPTPTAHPHIGIKAPCSAGFKSLCNWSITDLCLFTLKRCDGVNLQVHPSIHSWYPFIPVQFHGGLQETIPGLVASLLQLEHHRSVFVHIKKLRCSESAGLLLAKLKSEEPFGQTCQRTPHLPRPTPPLLFVEHENVHENHMLLCRLVWSLIWLT